MIEEEKLISWTLKIDMIWRVAEQKNIILTKIVNMDKGLKV